MLTSSTEPSSPHETSHIRSVAFLPQSSDKRAGRSHFLADSEDRWAAAGDMGELSAGLESRPFCAAVISGASVLGGAGESVMPAGLRGERAALGSGDGVCGCEA